MRGPSGFPDRVLVKLRYCDNFNLEGALTPGFNRFRGNSCFDPDYTGVGHQPYAFDQWSAFYGIYRVYGSKIRVQATPVINAAGFSSAALLPVWMAVVPRLGTASLSNPTPLEEMPYCKWRLANIAQAGSKATIISSYMSTAKIWGQPRQNVKMEDDYTALITTNPVNQWYWDVFVAPESNIAAQDVTYSCVFQITYYVEFSARNNLSQS